MPFVEVTPEFQRWKRRRAAVRFAVRSTKLGNYFGMVSIPRHVVEELGWTLDSRLRLLIGSGREAGIIRLEVSATGPIPLARGSRGAHVLMAYLCNFRGATTARYQERRRRLRDS